MLRLRLMTYNVHHCRGMDGRIDLQRIADVIARHEPDIVALQELDVGRARTRWVDQPRRLAQILDMDYHFRPTIRMTRGEYGTALLSRWPFRTVRSALLPTLGDRRLEDRGAVWVGIRAGDVELQIVAAHLGLTRGERRLQAQALLGPEWLSHPDCREPRILCGDFNMSRRGEYSCFDGVCVRSHWSQAGPPPRTWPSLVPLVPLDHIFFSDGVALESIRSPRGISTRLASDHLPVIATFHV